MKRREFINSSASLAAIVAAASLPESLTSALASVESIANRLLLLVRLPLADCAIW
jgi:hypothetical protein